MDADLKSRLQKLLTPEELAVVEGFLNKGFSLNGEVVIASVFGYAKDNKVPFEKVLEVCEKEWERNWNFQHPELRGDPDAPGAAGRQNRFSLCNIYEALGIPNPHEAGTKNIPKGPFVVTTLNSVYRVGNTNNGSRERTISRDGRPLDFTQGEVLFLVVGKPMFIKISDDSDGGSDFHTSIVKSIQEG